MLRCFRPCRSSYSLEANTKIHEDHEDCASTARRQAPCVLCGFVFLSGSFDVDGFHVREFPDSVSAELPPVARLLDAAKWQPRIGRDERVDERTSSLELSRNPFASRHVLREHRRA